jgi:MFS family permease
MRLELKAIKKQGKLLKIGQGFLFIALLLVLYWQLSKFNWMDFNWSGPKNSMPFLLAALLIGLNWFFEWKKWTFIAARIGLTEKGTIKRGFYAGMLSGFLTPSALGNFIGRVSEVDKAIRYKVVSFTFFANGAQFLASVFFGLISLYILQSTVFHFNTSKIFVVLPLLFSVLLIVYFRIEKIPILNKLIARYAPSVKEISSLDRLVFLGYSFFRYLVFSFQFYLVLIAFQPELDIQIWFWVWNLYLWTTFSPSLFMGKLFIRETFAVFILQQAGVEMPIALFSSLLIWMMNNALPSLVAYFIWKKDVLV